MWVFHYKEYIYCVYKEKNFTRAAEKLHISQPSLSVAIRKEEEEVGHPIFNRKTSPITLTPFGVEYIRSIEQIRELEMQLQNMAFDLHSLQAGTLSIGASNLNIPHFLPRVLAEFKKLYPGVTLHIEDTNTINAKQLLDSGSLDIIITNNPYSQTEYEIVPVYREQLIVAIPASFEINRRLDKLELTQEDLAKGIFSVPDKRGVCLKEFGSVPFILLSTKNYLRTCTDILFKEAGITPQIVMEFEQSSISYNFARYGIGATIFSNRYIEEMDLGADLKYYKINSAYATRTGYACYRKGSYVTTGMRTFLDMLLKAS